MKSILPARGSDRRRKVWLDDQAESDSANHILQCLSSHSFPANDVDTLWTQWHNFFMTTISQSIPSKVVKPNRKLSYLTVNLKRALKRKLKLFQEAKRLNTERTWIKYSKARNKATTALRSAKSNFFKSLSTKLKSPKDFWATYHKLSPKKDRIPTDLKLENTTARTSHAKANLLNNFISSCFSHSTRLNIRDLQPTTIGSRLSSVPTRRKKCTSCCPPTSCTWPPDMIVFQVGCSEPLPPQFAMLSHTFSMNLLLKRKCRPAGNQPTSLLYQH